MDLVRHLPPARSNEGVPVLVFKAVGGTICDAESVEYALPAKMSIEEGDSCAGDMQTSVLYPLYGVELSRIRVGGISTLVDACSGACIYPTTLCISGAMTGS